MKLFNPIFLTALAAVTAMIAVPNAFAAASKTMSGAACTFKDVVGSVDPRRSVDERGYKNVHTAPINATCDLVRDNSTNTTKPVDVYVRVTDNSTAFGFNCAVWSCSYRGENCASTTFSTGDAETGPKSINAPVPQSFYNGYYAVTCSVPPDSTIHSLYVYEPD